MPVWCHGRLGFGARPIVEGLLLGESLVEGCFADALGLDLSGENTNTTKEFSLVVFFVETGLHKGSLREGAGAVRRLRESALL